MLALLLLLASAITLLQAYLLQKVAKVQRQLEIVQNDLSLMKQSAEETSLNYQRKFEEAMEMLKKEESKEKVAKLKPANRKPRTEEQKKVASLKARERWEIKKAQAQLELAQQENQATAG